MLNQLSHPGTPDHLAFFTQFFTISSSATFSEPTIFFCRQFNSTPIHTQYKQQQQKKGLDPILKYRGFLNSLQIFPKITLYDH